MKIQSVKRKGEWAIGEGALIQIPVKEEGKGDSDIILFKKGVLNIKDAPPNLAEIEGKETPPITDRSVIAIEQVLQHCKQGGVAIATTLAMFKS